jgi:hypothetical protein
LLVRVHEPPGCIFVKGHSFGGQRLPLGQGNPEMKTIVHISIALNCAALLWREWRRAFCPGCFAMTGSGRRSLARSGSTLSE